MTNEAWQLYRTNDLGEWTLVANFESLAATARRITEIEAMSVRVLFFQMQVDLDETSDAEAIGHIEYQGKHGAYVIKRQAS